MTVEVDGDRGLGRGGRVDDDLALRLGAVVDVEDLVVDVPRVDAALDQQRLGTGDHAERPAEVPLVDGADRQQRAEDRLEPLPVEPAVEELDVLGLS
jgi:hypothetical protein